MCADPGGVLLYLTEADGGSCFSTSKVALNIMDESGRGGREQGRGMIFEVIALLWS